MESFHHPTSPEKRLLPAQVLEQFTALGKALKNVYRVNPVHEIISDDGSGRAVSLFCHDILKASLGYKGLKAYPGGRWITDPDHEITYGRELVERAHSEMPQYLKELINPESRHVLFVTEHINSGRSLRYFLYIMKRVYPNIRISIASLTINPLFDIDSVSSSVDNLIYGGLTYDSFFDNQPHLSGIHVNVDRYAATVEESVKIIPFHQFEAEILEGEGEISDFEQIEQKRQDYKLLRKELIELARDIVSNK